MLGSPEGKSFHTQLLATGPPGKHAQGLSACKRLPQGLRARAWVDIYLGLAVDMPLL